MSIDEPPACMFQGHGILRQEARADGALSLARAGGVALPSAARADDGSATFVSLNTHVGSGSFVTIEPGFRIFE